MSQRKICFDIDEEFKKAGYDAEPQRVRNNIEAIKRLDETIGRKLDFITEEDSEGHITRVCVEGSEHDLDLIAHWAGADNVLPRSLFEKMFGKTVCGE